MKEEELKGLVKMIVEHACALKDKHMGHNIRYKNAHVNYACIFSHSEDEYGELLDAAANLGDVIKETPTGPLFHITAVKTVSGPLKLLKIRRPDPARKERGYADFTIPDFPEFEKEYLPKESFRRMEKKGFYMIELMDPGFDVRAYFSNPPLDEQIGIG
ncbi:MAG: hypothetical protein R6U32_06990 [Candidatus Woesearchaeota archaeon]